VFAQHETRWHGCSMYGRQGHIPNPDAGDCTHVKPANASGTFVAGNTQNLHLAKYAMGQHRRCGRLIGDVPQHPWRANAHPSRLVERQ
jgi:hypothetical protein